MPFLWYLLDSLYETGSGRSRTIPPFPPSLLSNLRPRARPSAIPYVLLFVDDLLYVSNVTKLVLPLVHVYVISAFLTKTQSVFRVLGQ